ncbi:MAG: protein kinase [Planctomycetes bacterium]|nr:protein kinase [Planctomycetota bacterium]
MVQPGVSEIPEDRLFGTLAVKEGYASSEQVEECLQLLKTSGSGARGLQEVMLEKAYLTQEQCAALLEIQNRKVIPLTVEPGRGGLFGQIALDLGFVTMEQLQECLEEQNRLSAEGSPVLIGQLLLRKGYIKTSQFLQILRLQSRGVVRCPGCDTFYRIESGEPGERFACRRCGTVVAIPMDEEATMALPGSRGPFLSSPKPADGRFQLGRYELLEELGRGGMGIVYKAFHKDLNALFAVKVLRETEFSTPDQLARFRREAHTTARLKHPNIVTIHDAGEENGVPYIAMDYIDGEPLTAHLERKHRLRDMVIWLEKVVRAVEYAHEQGVIHRDLKPGNVMIDSRGEPRIMDFGLAKFTDDKQMSVLTRSGSFLGTPYYMAPEQIKMGSEAVDARSDVYALGVILYEMICGHPPHGGDNSAAVFNRIVNDEPIPPQVFNPKIHIDLQTICMRAIEKDPRSRYLTAAEFADDLRRYLDGEPIMARPRSWSYRLVRRIRKNKAAGLAAVALVLLTFSGGMVLYLVNRDATSFDKLKAEARHYFRRGYYEETSSVLESARKLKPNDPEIEKLAQETAARMYARRQESLQRLAREERRRKVEPLVLDAASMIDGLPRQVLAEFMDAEKVAARCADIEQLLDKALEEVPDHEEVLYLRGRSRQFRGAVTAALDDFTLAVAAAPEHVESRYERGRLRLSQVCMAQLLSPRPAGFPRSPTLWEARDQAKQDFKDVWARVRDRVKTDFCEMAFAFLNGKFDVVAARLDAHLARRPQDVKALLMRAIVRWTRGDAQRAETDLNLAIQCRPSDARLLAWRARIRETRENRGGADRDFATALALDPQNARLWCARGRIRRDRSQWDEALADFARAGELDPRFSEAIVGTAQVLIARGDANRALESLSRAAERAPNDPFPRFLRAQALASLKRSDEALAEADEAVRRAPRAAAVYEERGRIRFGMERFHEALQDFDKAIELDPSAGTRLETMLKAAKEKATSQ